MTTYPPYHAPAPKPGATRRTLWLLLSCLAILGIFTPSALPQAEEPKLDEWTILPGSWNSDAYRDVILLNRTSSVSLTWLAGNDGKLKEPFAQQLNGIGPSSAEKFRFIAGAVDQILICGFDLSTIDILRVSSTGLFTLPPYRSFRDVFQPLGTAIADVTNDGAEDIVSFWYSKPTICIHRQASRRFNTSGYFQAARTGEPYFNIHDLVVTQWTDTPAPEIAFCGTVEGGPDRLRILSVVDLGVGIPSIRMDQISVADLPNGAFHHLASFDMDGSFLNLLLVWGEGESSVLVFDPNAPEASPIEWDLGFPVGKLLVNDVDQDSDDDLLVLSEDHTRIVVFTIQDGIPTEASAFSPTFPVQAWSTYNAPDALQLWLFAEHPVSGQRALLEYKLNAQGPSPAQAAIVPPIASPFSEPTNLLLERSNLAGTPSPAAATRWAGGIGDWTVSGALVGDNQIAVSTQEWIDQDTLSNPVEMTWTSPVTIEMTTDDSWAVNQTTPETSQVFLGKGQGLESILLAHNPPGGYYPEPVTIHPEYPSDEYPMFFLHSEGPPPGLVTSSQLAIPSDDTLSLFGIAYLDISHPEQVQFAIGPRPRHDVDADQDGLSDAWEYLFFRGLSASPDQDPDGDSYSNGEEQNGGSIPIDPQSIPELPTDPPPAAAVSISRSGDVIVLRWQNYPNARYRLQSADSIHSAWTDVEEYSPSADPLLIRERRLTKTEWETSNLLLRVLSSW